MNARSAAEIALPHFSHPGFISSVKEFASLPRLSVSKCFKQKESQVDDAGHSKRGS
jgi:hypothetical protein